MGSAVEEKLDEIRLDQSLFLIRFATHLVGPLLAAMVVLDLIDPPPFLFTVEYLIYYCCVAVFYLSILLLTYKVIRLSPLKLDILYALGMAGWAWWAYSTEDINEVLLSTGCRVGTVMLFTFVYMHVWKALPQQIAMSLVMIYRVFESDIPQRHLCIYYEALTCAVIMLACYAHRQWVWKHCRVQLSLENQRGAATTLLGFQSEAILWLDNDLRIKGPARQLAALLMFGDVPGYLDGNEFSRYIATQSDRERFHDFLVASMAMQQADRPPSAIHVDLRDAVNTVFSVEVFHVYCVDDDDRFGHLLGIMEVDREQQRHQQQPPIRAQRAAAPKVRPLPTSPSRPRASNVAPNVIGATSGDGQGERYDTDSDDGRGLGFASVQQQQPRAERSAMPNSAPSRSTAPVPQPQSRARSSIAADEGPAEGLEDDSAYTGAGLGLFSAPRREGAGAAQEGRAAEEGADTGAGIGSFLGAGGGPGDDARGGFGGHQDGEAGTGFRVSPQGAIGLDEPDVDSKEHEEEDDRVTGQRLGFMRPYSAHEDHEHDPTASSSTSVASSASFSSISSVAVFPEGVVAAPVCVLFDCVTTEILCCTEGFRALMGTLLRGASLQDVVIDFQRFHGWLQYEASWIIGQGETEPQRGPFEIRVAPPIMRRRKKAVLIAKAFLTHASVDVQPSSLGADLGGGSLREVGWSCGGARDRERDMLGILEFRDVWQKRESKKRTRRGVKTINTVPSRGYVGKRMTL